MDDPGYLGKFWVGRHEYYRSIFFALHISQSIIEILGPTHYIKNVMDDPGNLGKFWQGCHDHYMSIFFVYL